jgi:hypothetical protein
MRSSSVQLKKNGRGLVAVPSLERKEEMRIMAYNVDIFTFT